MEKIVSTVSPEGAFNEGNISIILTTDHSGMSADITNSSVMNTSLEGTGLNTTSTSTLNKISTILPTTTRMVDPEFIMKEYDYESAEFEIFLPCIFGLFVILALSLVMFYMKRYGEDYITMSEPKSHITKEGIQNRPEFTAQSHSYSNGHVTNSHQPRFHAYSNGHVNHSYQSGFM